MHSNQIDFEQVRKASICNDMKQGCLDNLDSCCILFPMYNKNSLGTESFHICVQGDHSICNNLEKVII